MVAVAACAPGFDAAHAVGIVFDGDDVLRVDRRSEARPAGAAVELCVLTKERQTAQAAAIDARFLLIQKATAERGFGAVVKKHAAFVFVEARFKARALLCARRREIEAGG